MPEPQRTQLQQQARRDIKSKGKYQDVKTRRKAYVFGGMRRTGWKPKPPYTHKKGVNV